MYNTWLHFFLLVCHNDVKTYFDKDEFKRGESINEMPINALIFASKLGRTEIVKLLLTKGANPRSK